MAREISSVTATPCMAAFLNSKLPQMARGPKRFCIPFRAGTTDSSSTELSFLSILPETCTDRLPVAPTISGSYSNWCGEQMEAGSRRFCTPLEAEPTGLQESGVQLCPMQTATSSGPRPGMSSNSCRGRMEPGQRRYCTPLPEGATGLFQNRDSRWTRPAISMERPMRVVLTGERLLRLRPLPTEPGLRGSFTHLNQRAAMESIHSP